MKNIIIYPFLLILLLPSLALAISTSGPPDYDCIFAGSAKMNNEIVDATAVQAYYQDNNELIGNAIKVELGYSIVIKKTHESLIMFKINNMIVNEQVQSCNDIRITPVDLTVTDQDNDKISLGDGDCNDDDNKIHPDAIELLDGVDNNCNNKIDEGFNTGGTTSEDVHTNIELNELNIEKDNEDNFVFKENNDIILVFPWTSADPLNLANVVINKQDVAATIGSIEISGITLPKGQTKTVYIDNIANKDYVCIKDEENANVSEMTDTCSGSGEIAVSCDGTVTNGYTCTKENSKLKVTGLKHSAVEESSYSPPTPSTPASSSSGGGGGGTRVTTTTPLKVDECTTNADCKENEICTDVINENGIFEKRCVVPTTPPEVTPTVTTTETTTIPTTGGLGAVTGAVVGAVKSNSTTIIVVISVILVILVLTRVGIKNPFGKGKSKDYRPSAKYE